MSRPLRFAVRLLVAIEVQCWLRMMRALGWLPKRPTFEAEDVDNWVPEGMG